MSAENLKSKAISSALLVVISNVISQLLRLGSNLVLTRLLAPEMFGLMAVAYAIQFGLNLLSDIGLSQNLIQSNKSDNPRYVNTLWTLQVARGGVIFSLGLVAAVTIFSLNKMHFFSANTVYADVNLPTLIVLMTMSQLVMGFQSTNVAFAIRNLNMFKKVLLELSGQAFSIAVTILLAFYWRSVWPLAIGGVVSAVYIVYTSHRFLPGPPNHFCWERGAVHDILHFGKWVFLSSIVGFLSISGDRFVLGGLVSAHILGLYTTAFFISNSITELLNKLYAFTAYPVLSEVYRTNPSQIKHTYYKLRLPIDVSCLFFAGFIFTSGHYIIDLLYDHRYHEAGRMLQVLSLSLLLNRYTLVEQLYLAIGKPKLLFPMSFLKAFGIMFLMPLILKAFGFNVGLYAIALNGLLSLPLIIYNKYKLSLVDLKKELMVLPMFFVGMLTGNVLNTVLF